MRLENEGRRSPAQNRNSAGKGGDGPGPRKAQGEALAFQTSLGKEQVRVYLLERTVEQKTEETMKGPESGTTSLPRWRRPKV